MCRLGAKALREMIPAADAPEDAAAILVREISPARSNISRQKKEFLRRRPLRIKHGLWRKPGRKHSQRRQMGEISRGAPGAARGHVNPGIIRRGVKTGNPKKAGKTEALEEPASLKEEVRRVLVIFPIGEPLRNPPKPCSGKSQWISPFPGGLLPGAADAVGKRHTYRTIIYSISQNTLIFER